MSNSYVLEVQKFIGNVNNNGKFEHIGYMNKIFTNKSDACIYYNRYNSHMRKLLHVYWNNCSDWDQNTQLRYIVREYYGECLKIEPFENTNI